MTDLRLDPDVIDRAREGDAAAVNLVLARLRPVFEEFFRWKVRDRFLANDLVHNALMRVHKGLKQLRNLDSLKPFAMKAARYELLDMYRGRYSPKELVLDPDKTPELVAPSQSVDAGLRLDVNRALNSLTPRARRILELKEFGYRYREIADMLGMTEAAVKMQVRRAFKTMREALTD